MISYKLILPWDCVAIFHRLKRSHVYKDTNITGSSLVPVSKQPPRDFWQPPSNALATIRTLCDPSKTPQNWVLHGPAIQRLFVIIVHCFSLSHFPDYCSDTGCQGPPGAQVTVADLCLSVNGTSPAVRTGRSRVLLRAICASSIITVSKQQVSGEEREKNWKNTVPIALKKETEGGNKKRKR